MKPTRPVTLVIDVANDGTATIQIPHDNRNLARDANAAADFTDKLSKALGEVLERHIGDHHHHTHQHTNGEIHSHE